MVDIENILKLQASFHLEGRILDPIPSIEVYSIPSRQCHALHKIRISVYSSKTIISLLQFGWAE